MNRFAFTLVAVFLFSRLGNRQDIENSLNSKNFHFTMADTNQEEDTPYQDDPSQPLPESAELAPPDRPTTIHIRRLTLTSLGVSGLSFFVGIVLTILIAIGESHSVYTPWAFRDTIGWLIFVVCKTPPNIDPCFPPPHRFVWAFHGAITRTCPKFEQPLTMLFCRLSLPFSFPHSMPIAYDMGDLCLYPSTYSSMP